MKTRLDVLLVKRGFFETRAKAQAAVMAGKVLADGKPALKAGSQWPADAALEILADACPYVSRGGLKLESALKNFQVPVEGKICLDMGASTGGFSDCLLAQGAAKVYAVDVGTAQLAAKLKADPRVVSLEKTHARLVKPEWFNPRPQLAVADVSFISLTQVLPFIVPCLAPPFEILALIKPQFELTPKQVPKGVVRDPDYRQEAVEKVRRFIAQSGWGLREAGLMECPIHGPKGNVEFFIYLSYNL